MVNLQAAYERFWSEANGRPFSEKLKFWDALVEKSDQDFYDTLVWSKRDGSNYQERKTTRLREFLARYPQLRKKMTANFSSFEKTLAEQIEKYRRIFPDAKFNLPIYAALAPTFNGKTGTLSSQPKQTVLAFGIDTIADRDDPTDILYSHELFHIYHTELMGGNDEVVTQRAKLMSPLWREGLATYVSGILNPRQPDGALLMDASLGRLTQTDLQSLAKTFLTDADESTLTDNERDRYMKWFGMGDSKVRKDLPNRCGYLLGLGVVRVLAKRYSLAEMTHWKPAHAQMRVLEALRLLAHEGSK